MGTAVAMFVSARISQLKVKGFHWKGENTQRWGATCKCVCCVCGGETGIDSKHNRFILDFQAFEIWISHRVSLWSISISVIIHERGENYVVLQLCSGELNRTSKITSTYIELENYWCGLFWAMETDRTNISLEFADNI